MSSAFAHMPPALRPSADDVVKMLAANVHIGTKNLEPQMARYSFKRRSDGVYVMNLASFWEKLTLAARIIVAIENPADVCVISARPFGTRSIFKYAQYTGAQYLPNRYTPGTFTNQITKKFMEPRLVIVTDPRTDHQVPPEPSFFRGFLAAILTPFPGHPRSCCRKHPSDRLLP
jgi:small subunit ribosomal protein SAe